MRSRLKFIFLLATFTAGCILLFQVYWAWNSYQITKTILREQAGTILQNTIYNYRRNLVRLPRSLNGQRPTLSVLMRLERIHQGKTSASLKDDLRGQQVTMALEDMNIPNEDIPAVNRLLAKLLKVTPGGKLDLQEISDMFHDDLRHKNIGLHYDLSIRRASAPIFAKVEITGKRYLISAVPENETTYLLIKVAQPISISILLVLLTGGCLAYMATNMKRQLQLDDLKNNFITNLSHEFRTPIAAMQSTHEALVNFGQLNDPQRSLQYLTMNMDILKKLNRNVDHLLETSRLSTQAVLPPGPLRQLSAAIHETMSGFQKEGAHHIQVLMQETIGNIMVNAYALDTILSNLLDNAIKYSPGRPQIVITLVSSAKFWELMVSDKGVGIPAKYHPYLFDRFFRVPQGDLHDVKGYGLGLSYVYELVRLINGKIRVASSPGNGTTFIIQFPYV